MHLYSEWFHYFCNNCTVKNVRKTWGIQGDLNFSTVSQKLTDLVKNDYEFCEDVRLYSPFISDIYDLGVKVEIGSRAVSCTLGEKLNFDNSKSFPGRWRSKSLLFECFLLMFLTLLLQRNHWNPLEMEWLNCGYVQHFGAYEHSGLHSFKLNLSLYLCQHDTPKNQCC